MPGKAARYRVHIYDLDDQHRWLASADFPVRPDQAAINAAFGQLQGPGWFEVRITRLRGEDELHLAGWTQEDGTPGRKSVRPMEAWELRSGRYVCVARGGCLHSPHITITADGVWVRSPVPDPLTARHLYSSAHRDCYEQRNAEAAALPAESTDRPPDPSQAT